MRINTFFGFGNAMAILLFFPFMVPNNFSFSFIQTIKTEATTESIEEDYDYAKYYLVIADTGLSFALLHKTMFELSSKTGIAIDTMGRIYDSKTNKIILPYDDTDEMYAGQYFPRRFPSEHLSMEYLNFYSPKADTGTIALLAGIFEEKKKADSLLKVLKPVLKSAYMQKASVYVGCMH
jgi:hypothetical protein